MIYVYVFCVYVETHTQKKIVNEDISRLINISSTKLQSTPLIRRGLV